MKISNQLIDELKNEAKSDEVGLWLIIRVVQEDLGVTKPAEVKKTALHLIQKLISSGQIHAASYSSDGSGYVVWDGTVDDILKRISDEWDALKRTPNIGDIVTFLWRQN